MRAAPIQKLDTLAHLPLEAEVIAPEPETVMQRGVIRMESTLEAPTDFAISPAERTAAARGDLATFWRLRGDRDPVARTGLALWGRPEDLRDLVDGSRPSKITYVPKLSFPLRWIVRLMGGPAAPQSPGEVLEHWTWIGNETRTRVRGALERQGYTGDGLRERMHALGVSIMRAHVRAVDADIASNQGNIRGALSPRQIADYHHDVLSAFGLGESTYGGTPYWWLPDWFELWFLQDLYCLDCDSH